MKDLGNGTPTAKKPERYEPKYNYLAPISLGQQKIFDALIDTMKLRTEDGELALEKSLLPLKAAIDEHLQGISDPKERQLQLDWIHNEFGTYRARFDFKPDELHMFDSFEERIYLDYSIRK